MGRQPKLIHILELEQSNCLSRRARDGSVSLKMSINTVN